MLSLGNLAKLPARPMKSKTPILGWYLVNMTAVPMKIDDDDDDDDLHTCCGRPRVRGEGGAHTSLCPSGDISDQL